MVQGEKEDLPVLISLVREDMRDSWSRVRTAWSEEREKPRWCQDPSLRICEKGFKNIVKFDFPYK